MKRGLRAWWQQLGRRDAPFPTVQVQRGGPRYDQPPPVPEPLTLTLAAGDLAPTGSIMAAGGWCAPSEMLYDLTSTPRWRLALSWVAFSARCWLADRIDPRARWTDVGYADDEDYDLDTR